MNHFEIIISLNIITSTIKNDDVAFDYHFLYFPLVVTTFFRLQYFINNLGVLSFLRLFKINSTFNTTRAPKFQPKCCFEKNKQTQICKSRSMQVFIQRLNSTSCVREKHAQKQYRGIHYSSYKENESLCHYRSKITI